MSKKSTSPAKETKKKSPWITVLIALAVLLIALILLDVIGASVSIYGWAHPEKKTPESFPSDYGLDYYSFELETDGGVIWGWKIAAQTPVPPDAEEWVYTTEYSDKTVVIASNYDSSRENFDLGGLDYAVDLCSAGYNVFLFDWTGSGSSDGTKNVFTLDKVEELKAVVRYAAEETKSSFLAVQGVGFSCYPAAVAAAECVEVDGLILDSCYEEFESVFYGRFPDWSGVDIAPFRSTVKALFPLLTGVKTEGLTLADPINALNGKHVLFIQGESDEVFGSSDAEHLSKLAAVDNETTVWMVAGAGHLRARAFDAEGYLKKVSGFLEDSYQADHAA